MKCAVIIPVGPGHEYLAEDSIDSVQGAFKKNPGPFSEMTVVRVDDTRGLLGRSAARNKGVADAQAQGAEWLFFLDADDLMDAGAFGVMADFHADHDAVWGLICELNQDEETYTVRTGQLTSIERLEQLLINDPTLTLQMGHFVRTGVAAATPFDIAFNCGEDFDYYLRLWEQFRCRKIARPLFLNRRGFHSTGPRSATGRQWSEAVRSVIRARCQAANLVCDLECEAETFRFRIVDPFEPVQWHLLRGKFHELAELLAVRNTLKKGAAILELGADIGVRAVFLSRFLTPVRMVLLEPDAGRLDALRANLAANSVKHADTAILGTGAGNGQYYPEARVAEPAVGYTSGIGTAPSAAVRFQLPEAIVGEKADLIVINVAGRELELLEQLKTAIGRSRPNLLLIAASHNLEPLDAWRQRHRYRIVGRFQYTGAVHLFLGAEPEI